MDSEMKRELLELFEEIDSTLEEAKSLLVSVKKISSFPESKGIAVKIPIKRQPSAAFEKTIYEPIPMGIEHKTVQPIEKKQDYNSLQDTIVLPPKIQLDNDLKENSKENLVGVKSLKDTNKYKLALLKQEMSNPTNILLLSMCIILFFTFIYLVIKLI